MRNGRPADPYPISEPLRAEVYAFLDALRESGEINNMFGAGPVVAEAFAIPRREARGLVMAWMEQFGGGDEAA